MARKQSASRSRGNLSDFLAPRQHKIKGTSMNGDTQAFEDIHEEYFNSNHDGYNISKISQNSDQIFASSMRNKDINSKHIHKLDDELNSLRKNGSLQLYDDIISDEYWNSNASFAATRNKDAIVQLSTAQPIKFDTTNIELEYPERTTIQLLDDLRLERLYAKRRETSSERDTSTINLLHSTDPYSNLYSDFQEDLNRMGSYDFSLASNDIDQNQYRDIANERIPSTFHKSTKKLSNHGPIISTSIHPLSPRSAAWKESTKRNLIPIMLEDLFRKSRQPYIVHESDDQKLVDNEFDDNKSDMKEGKIDIVDEEVVSINVRGRLLGDDYGALLAQFFHNFSYGC